MPIIPEKVRAPFCPYCYEGIIIKDKQGHCFCEYCGLEVKIEER